MTFWHYIRLSYLVVAVVFAVLILTSEEVRLAALEQPGWRLWVLRFFLATIFGCLWPIVVLVWVLGAIGVGP